MYEDCRREKDTMVVKFAAAEAKNMEAKKISEKSETKVRDAFRDRDNMASALKAAKVDRQRAIANYDGKVSIGVIHENPPLEIIISFRVACTIQSCQPVRIVRIWAWEYVRQYWY